MCQFVKHIASHLEPTECGFDQDDMPMIRWQMVHERRSRYEFRIQSLSIPLVPSQSQSRTAPRVACLAEAAAASSPIASHHRPPASRGMEFKLPLAIMFACLGIEWTMSRDLKTSCEKAATHP
jgi:hypothetical protein